MNGDGYDGGDDEDQISDDDIALHHHGFDRLWDKPQDRAIKWLYENYIPRGSLAVLVGESGIGKSTFAVDLCVAVATATPFAGHDYASPETDQDSALHDTPTYSETPSNAIYIYGEGDASLATRFSAAYEMRKMAFMHTHARSFAASDMYKLPIYRMELICTNEGPTSLRSTIERMKASKDYKTMVKATKLSYGLIVVDTLIAVSGISSENESGAMQNCINCLKELGREFKATVLVIVHPKKNTNEIRGSSALYNAADVVLRIEKQSQSSDVLRLVHQKARHGQKQPPKLFQIVPFAGDPLAVGGEIMPPVIEWFDSEPKQSQIMSRVKRNETAKLIAQPEHTTDERDMSGIDVYIEAAKLAIMGQGKPDAAGFTWTTLDAIRGEFDRIYQRNPEANRKAFERAHNRAVREGKVVVCTVDGGRQLVRVVE